jgi:DsbC/DsbD-like thiol-disulfide interchange protein
MMIRWGRERGGAAAGAAVAALILGGAAAGGFASDWAKSAKSEARLVAAGPDLAALQIRLAPNAVTYWRDPGDAGVPPTFDFAGSVNVASVEPVFPAPTRLPESDGSVAFGWSEGVVIPLRVKPKDPGKPVTLAAHVNYAVCEKLCLPAEAKLSLTLPAKTAPDAPLVEAALAAAPRVVAPEALGAIAAAGADAWRFCAPHEAGPPRDLFVEPPPGWWVTSAPAENDRDRDCFALALRQTPAGAAPPVALRLTLTGGAGPLEATLTAPALR